MLRPHGPGPRELRKRGIHQQRGGEQRIVRNSIATRTSRDDVGERFGPASQSLRTSSNLRLYLRDSGIKPEALSGGRRLWLAEPGLKPAVRRMRSVRRRTSIGADLINEVSQTRRCGVSEGDITLHHWPPTTYGSHELSEWEEGQKEPNWRWTVGEADPHNAEAEGKQKRRRGAEWHPESPRLRSRMGAWLLHRKSPNTLT